MPAAEQPTEILHVELQCILNKISVTKIYSTFLGYRFLSFFLFFPFYPYATFLNNWVYSVSFLQTRLLFCKYSLTPWKKHTCLMLGLTWWIFFCPWNAGGSENVLVSHLDIKRRPVFLLAQRFFPRHGNHVPPGSYWPSSVGPGMGQVKQEWTGPTARIRALVNPQTRMRN